MHLKMIFGIVLLQLLLTVYAGEGDIAGNPDKHSTPQHVDVSPTQTKIEEGAEELKVEKASGKRLVAGTKQSRGLNGAAERAVAVDLTRGWCHYLPRSTREACWTVFPKCTCQRCNMQGVMKLSQPFWARVLTIVLIFEKPYKYSFNIGNSRNNNAWGGDGNPFNCWDAEIHNYHHRLYVWRNQWAWNSLLYYNKYIVRTAMMIRIYRYGVYITNYEGINVWRCSYAFFKMYPRNYVWVGMNRVIKRYNGAPSPWHYTGRGLCFMAAWWK